MLSTIEKRRIKKVVFSKVTLILLTVLLVLLARGTWGVYKKSQYADTNKERVERELGVLVERDEFLKSELEHLDSARGQEAEIRRRFDVGHVGERLIVLVDAAEPQPTSEPKKHTWWGKALNFVRLK